MTNEDWRSVTFKECTTHKGLLFACDRCPVCVAIEEREEALGRAEYEKTQLEGTVAALEERLQGYKDELRL